MKKLSRVRAWTKIRTAFQYVKEMGSYETRIAQNGLCWAVCCLFEEEKITMKVVSKMHEDIESVKPRGCRGAWYWHTASGDIDATRKGAASRVRAINRILKNI